MLLAQLCLTLCAACGGGAPSSFAEALAALDADSAREREAGERWFARSLAHEHLAALRAALAGAGAEPRLRLRNALATAAGGFDLCVRLALEGAGPAAAAGHDALLERVARWSPGWLAPPSSGGQVLARLSERPGDVYALSARAADGRVDLALDQLARGVGALPPLVLAPRTALVPQIGVGRSALTGTAGALLAGLARTHQLSLAGYDFGDEPAPASHPWILLAAGEGETRSAAELVVEWCTLAAGAELLPARRSAARALGAAVWPDAIAWMGERWRDGAQGPERDLVWLDGLLSAAERGARSPVLAEREQQAWILEYFERPELEPHPELRRERIAAMARALRALGPRASDGGDLGALRPWPAGADQALAQWARLVIWEGSSSLGAAQLAALDERITTLGATGGTAARPELAGLLLQALRTRAVASSALTSAPAPVLERPEALLEWASRSNRLRAAVLALAGAGVAPPARWEDPAALPAGWSPELGWSALEWQLAAGSRSAAARHLARRAEVLSGAEVPAFLRRCRSAERAGWGAAAAQAWSEALAHAGAPALERLALALGHAPAERSALVCGECGVLETIDAPAACALGACAAQGDARAFARLTRALRSGPELEAGRAGLEWALERLRERGDEAAEQRLVEQVRGGLREASPALQQRFSAPLWPPAARPVPFDLAEGDRELPAELR